MKTLVKGMNLKMLFTFLVFNLLQLALIAQEETTTSSSTKKVDIEVSNNENWYAAPWVWIVGAAIFILLLVALIGGGRNRSGDRVSVTRTVERDTDV
jgi:hypothetical protein